MNISLTLCFINYEVKLYSLLGGFQQLSSTTKILFTPFSVPFFLAALRSTPCTNPHIPGEIADSTGMKFISHMAASVPPNHNLDWQFNPILHCLLPPPHSPYVSCKTSSPPTASFSRPNYEPAAAIRLLIRLYEKNKPKKSIGNINYNYSNGRKGVSEPVPLSKSNQPTFPTAHPAPGLQNEDRGGVKFGCRMWCQGQSELPD